jgi:hypothetical protein
MPQVTRVFFSILSYQSKFGNFFPKPEKKNLILKKKIEFRVYTKSIHKEPMHVKSIISVFLFIIIMVIYQNQFFE